MVDLRNIPITFLKIKAVFFYLKWCQNWNLDTFIFSWPPLTSWTLVGCKTSNFIVDFDVGKSKDFGVFLSESINWAWAKKIRFWKTFLKFGKKFLNFWVLENIIGIFTKTPCVQYYQDLLWDVSANVNNYFVLFATHSFTKL